MIGLLKSIVATFAGFVLAAPTPAAGAQPLPIFDTHMHYSQPA